MKMVLPQINFIGALRPTMSVTYTATLPVRQETALYLSGLLHAERLRRGTRRGSRALGCFKQAVLILRWFLDGTRMSQMACDNHIISSTGYDYVHEGIDLLAAQAPSLRGALLAAKAAGYSHVIIDGTLIETDRVRTPGPTEGVDLWWSGKHDNHGGNVQVITAPEAFRCGAPRYAPAASTTPPRCGHTPRSCPRWPPQVRTCARSGTWATKASPTPSPLRSRNPSTASCPPYSSNSTRSTTGYGQSASVATRC